MFPIRDHNPSRRTPWVTWALIVANVLIFIGTLPYFENERRLYLFFLEWGLVPARILAGEGYATFLTSMFLHGGWLHLLGNMLFLFVFGDNLEDEMGRLPFLGFYLASGVGAGLLQIAADPSSVIPMVGASGAIAGVMGGYLLLHPKARVDVLIIIFVFIRIVPLPAWIVLGLWLALQLVNGALDTAGTGGVAYWAHVGGFVVGALLALPLWLRLGGPEFWARTGGVPPHPETRIRMRVSAIPKVPRRR